MKYLITSDKTHLVNPVNPLKQPENSNFIKTFMQPSFNFSVFPIKHAIEN